MAGENRILHEDLKEYLEGWEKEHVQRLRENDAGYGMFFALLDRIQPKNLHLARSQKLKPYTFAEIDDLLDGLVSGTLSTADEKTLVQNLYHSADFFRRIQVRLEQMSETLAGATEKEMQQVAIRSDDELLAGMGILKSQADPVPARKSVLEKLKSWVAGFFPTPRYAYVFAAVLLILVSYFGLQFYNSTYQLMLAEDLLEKNYRVYIKETPRMSGGYGPTGISTLLAEESDRSSYLKEAQNLVQKVITSDNKNVEALHLESKILIINNDLEKALNILNRIEKLGHRSAKILNDLGVVNFRLGDFEQSLFYFDQALQDDPEEGEIYYNLALTYHYLGNNAKAIEMLTTYMTKEKDEGWYNAALQFYNNLKKDTE